MKTLRLFLPLFVVALAACGRQNPVKQLEALVKNQSKASTYEQWHDAHENLQVSGPALMQQALASGDCQSLDNLSDNDILSLHEFVFTSKQSSCRSHLLEKISTIRAQQISAYRFDSFPKLTPCTVNGKKVGPRQTLGPSLPKILDTTGGPLEITGDVARCQIIITLDDGPHPVYSQEMFKVFENEGITVDYFNLGVNARRYPEIVREAWDRGHIVGNHTQNHKNLPKYSYPAGLKEILDGFNSILAAHDIVAPFFRFPYGARTKALRAWLKSEDVAEFFWNMDSLDWKIKNPVSLYANVAREIEREKRGIILFHDIHPQTVAVMPHVLQALREAGYQVVQMQPKTYRKGF